MTQSERRGHSLDWADNIIPAGGWWYDTFLILVLELKNALGLSGDALLQAAIDYSKIVSREKVRFLISAASNHMAHLCLQYKHFRDFCNFRCRCHCKSPRNFCRHLCGIRLRVQATHARPFLRLSCL